MCKRIAILLLVFSLFIIPVSAERLPESNPIGETLVIEPDENIVADNMRDEDETEPLPEIIVMTREEYADRYFEPILLSLVVSLLILALEKAIRHLKRKAPPDRL